MLRFASLLLVAVLAFLPIVLAQGLPAATIYWPVTSPSKTVPWVKGQKNLLAWRVAGGTGIDAFDIELHHWNRKVMQGTIKIALRFPMERLAGKYGNFGGEIEVDLGDQVPTGDGFVVSFSASVHGQVWAVSDPFSIYDTPPSNYSDNPEKLPTATVTATLDQKPNPTLGWAITQSGKAEVTQPVS